MKGFRFILVLLIPSCVGADMKNAGFSDLVFISEERKIDVLKVEGLNLGSLYGSSNISPQNVGKQTYVTSQGIAVADQVIISWRYSSSDQNETTLNSVIDRKEARVPEKIPDGKALNLLFIQGSWQMKVNSR